MRHWIRGLASNFLRRTPASPSKCRPTLEQLEDRCVPSANMMMSMGMNVPSMNMPSSNMPSMNMPMKNMPSMNMPSSNMPSMSTNTMSSMMNPTLMAAVDHLFVDFNQTLQQVMSSTTTQQFITNEIHMIDVLATDIAQIRMLV